LSRSEGNRATERSGAETLGENQEQILLERARLGIVLIMAGIAVVFVGAYFLHPDQRPYINLVQGINFVVGAVALRVLHDSTRRAFNFAIGYGVYVVTIVAAGTAGVLAGDATTPLIIFVGLSVITATLLPWSPWWQALSVLVITATAIWMVSTVITTPHLYWVQNVGSIAPTLVATVFISAALQRQRAVVEHAERDRCSREASLRTANARLEQEIQEHQRTEEALRFAMRELDHRVKNTLATVQSVADQTLRGAKSVSDFREAFAGRIQALARIHIALAGRRWEGLRVSDLIELVVGPYRHDRESVSIDCDETFVSSELVRVLGMTLHELATNAAKHGALSTKAGRVTISSSTAANGASRLHIRWSERDGPPVSTPTYRGFGMTLIEEALAYEVNGRVALQFQGGGVRCEIEVPVPLTSA